MERRGARDSSRNGGREERTGCDRCSSGGSDCRCACRRDRPDVGGCSCRSRGPSTRSHRLPLERGSKCTHSVSIVVLTDRSRVH
eukprot:484053-Pleurochrysis_carterae.AAC.1